MVEGRHVHGERRGFSWVVLWTVLGALVPGVGLIAAGRRRLGGAVLGIVAVLAATPVVLALTGNLQTTAVDLAVNSRQLLILAVAAPVVAVLWAAVILLTNGHLRRSATLDPAQHLVGAVVVLVLIAGVALPAYKVSDYAMITRSVADNTSVFAGDSEPARRPNTAEEDPWAGKAQMNVLLIGSDAGRGRIGIRPDTLILASINTRTGKTVMFSLPRSLQHAPFPAGTGGHEAWPDGYYCPQAGVGRECLLNALWVWAENEGQQYYSGVKNPGLRATEDAVEGVTGLKVDTYVMLNLNGFKDFVDAMDGVTVDVHERLPIGGSSHYPVAVGGYIEKGKNQHLDGYHALWFARSRWSTTDYDRMQRQRCVIGALVDQSDPLAVVRHFPGLAKALKKNLATGIDSADLSAWAVLAQRIQKGGVKSIVFDPDVINTVDPDIGQIHRLVKLAVRSTATVATTPTATASPAVTPSNSATTKTRTKKKTRTAKPGRAQSIDAVC